VRLRTTCGVAIFSAIFSRSSIRAHGFELLFRCPDLNMDCGISGDILAGTRFYHAGLWEVGGEVLVVALPPGDPLWIGFRVEAG